MYLFIDVGRSVAAAALAHGAYVVVASSSQERVNAAVDKLRQGIRSTSDVTVTGQVVDLKDFESLKAFLTKEGPFDHLVITAGNLPGNLNFPHQELEVNDSLKSTFDIRYWATIIASNNKAPMHILMANAKNSAQHIYKNKLINPGSSITQTIVESSTRGLSIDLKPIRVNTICLGAVDTEAHDFLPGNMKLQMFESLKQTLPVGHIGTPDEVAEAYLGVIKCTYLTGQVLVVDGGMTLV
ncbi:hypothetical protein FRC11_007824 [Ceratobasidium sp. 423]|nr:hypothetical protein FRC11_007824 [Ceratobasidium sp. 423]